MGALIERLARRLWPDFAQRLPDERQALLAELAVVCAAFPLLALALAALIAFTDVRVLRAQWPLFLLLLALSVALSYLSFYQRSGREAGRYSYNSSDLEGVINTSGLFLLGPTAIWIHLLNRLIYFGTTWPEHRFSLRRRWSWFRNLLYNLLLGIIGGLLIVGAYRAIGGRLPLPGLAPRDTLAAFVALSLELIVGAFFVWLLLLPFTYFLGRERIRGVARPTMRFFFVAGLPTFFGILGAALYSQSGLFAFLFFAAGVLLVSLLARRLSQAGMESQQRATELGQLERLGRAIIETPADLSHLSELLARSLPQMFDYNRAEIVLFGEGRLVQLPVERTPLPDDLWQWFEDEPAPASLPREATVPGRAAISAARLVFVPILSSDARQPIGGIALALSTEQVTPGLEGPLLSLQVLAAQIASALQRIETQAQMLAYERVRQELAFARQIQASFLPAALPLLPGWQLAATLQPARQTSGDFYDLIPLPGGQVGLVMADVADKGMGAALFMALSRTLVRTYAGTYPQQPAQVLAATNARILEETSNDMFVTIFYGVLDPKSGSVHYANAGHNPPYVGQQPLPLTGMPLGILPESAWESRRVAVAPGETLVLYTDGVSEAQNPEQAQFGTKRMLAALAANKGAGVEVMLDALLQAVAEFVGEADQFDDMTLMLLQREVVRTRPGLS